METTIDNTDLEHQLARLLMFLYGDRASIKKVSGPLFEVHRPYGLLEGVRLTLPEEASILKTHLEHLARRKIYAELSELDDLTKMGLGAWNEKTPSPDRMRGPQVEKLIRRIAEGRE